MKSVIRKLDRALKQMYRLEHDFRAEAFLIPHAVVPSAGQGAFFIQACPQETLEVGIFLDASVREALGQFPRGNWAAWSHDQRGAFAVAAEEVSHFNYFLHHQSLGRAVSQLELEVQGEIDKFLLSFFSGLTAVKESELGAKFELLLEQFFHRYHLVDNLSADQRARYEEASRVAKAFLSKNRRQLADPQRWEVGIKLLRRFYRATLADKTSLSNP